MEPVTQESSQAARTLSWELLWTDASTFGETEGGGSSSVPCAMVVASLDASVVVVRQAAEDQHLLASQPIERRRCCRNQLVRARVGFIGPFLASSGSGIHSHRLTMPPQLSSPGSAVTTTSGFRWRSMVIRPARCSPQSSVAGQSFNQRQPGPDLDELQHASCVCPITAERESRPTLRLLAPSFKPLLLMNTQRWSARSHQKRFPADTHDSSAHTI